jgi:glycosyltransferase involved in cell wall biosynthesis
VHGHGTRLALIESALSTHNAPTPNSQGDEGEVAEKIIAIRLGEGELVSTEREARARRDVRAKYGIDADAILFGCFGGLTPEKRIPQILAALAATIAYAPSARLLLAGARAAHYDPAADAAGHGVSDRVVFTGYLEDDEALTDHIAACDVSLNLRWPTARETSGPWLRALAAGKATVITDLAHLSDVPSLDPRTWRARVAGDARLPPPASTIAIDILDEDHSLRLAMRRLATDADLRATLGRAAREYWRTEHSPEVMVADYERVMKTAADARDGSPAAGAGDEKLRDLLTPFGLDAPI